MNDLEIKISKRSLHLYEKKMKKIENNIWDIIDNFDYYKTIRGILNEYNIYGKLSKRQTIRLYEFIYNIEGQTCTRDNINELYKIAKESLEK